MRNVWLDRIKKRQNKLKAALYPKDMWRDVFRTIRSRRTYVNKKVQGTEEQ